jgi:hypothetical protein
VVCPGQPYTHPLSSEKDQEEIVVRGTSVITFEGNGKLLKIVETRSELLHFQITNVHFPRTLKILPRQAQFSDLSLPVEIVQDDRRWFVGDRPRVVISCSNSRTCVTNGDGVANSDSLSFPVCDHDSASDVKAAIEELIRLNSSVTAQPPSAASPKTQVPQNRGTASVPISTFKGVGDLQENGGSVPMPATGPKPRAGEDIQHSGAPPQRKGATKLIDPEAPSDLFEMDMK